MLIAFKQLRELGIPFSPDRINRLVALGKFPAPVRIGLRRKAWLKAEIENWILALPKNEPMTTKQKWEAARSGDKTRQFDAV